ncbi:MAG: glycosyltransferase family 2 protein [Phycisphaeraceae bacterium]|nr:glycosyltransferase family 2 protein [Phycisphaeraceae bacterium]
MSRIGVVVIGRNEGDRLVRCIESLLGQGAPVVFADSGSTDGSAERARSLGADVVVLDSSAAHTAARGRNAGFARLKEMAAGEPPEYVQFVDGDCVIDPGWLQSGAAALDADPSLAIVCGELREKDRDATVYARLLDMEWHGPVGRIDTSGGIFMVRARAFDEIGGFLVGHAAGEEPDLCARLRGAGWGIARLEASMGIHDSGMTRFSQWWRRSSRAGWSYAKACASGSVQRSLKGRLRLMMTGVWAIGLPLFALAVTLFSAWVWPIVVAWVVVAALYGTLLWRIYRFRRGLGSPPRDARLYAAFCVLSKWPELCGQVRFWARG